MNGLEGHDIDPTENELGIEYWQIGVIESLFETSFFKNENIPNIIEMNYSEANEYILLLQKNQIDPIDSGLTYSMKDIKNKLNKYL